MTMTNAHVGTLGSQYCIGPQGFEVSGFVSQGASSVHFDSLDDVIWRFYFEYMISSCMQAIPNAVETQKEEVLATGEIFIQAKKVLGASISDLSEMLGISRPTVYSYLSGNEPSGNSELLMKRISFLQKTIGTIHRLGLSIPCSTMLKRRDTRGKTFKELLANDELNDESIQLFCHVEQQQRNRTKQRITAVPVSSDHRKNLNNEEFSVPGHLQ
ncbi:MAG: hypothetical protein KJ847_07215 [Firmicutes bacterium]|nr:hypothetical protein [Bacillota bacterium]